MTTHPPDTPGALPPYKGCGRRPYAPTDEQRRTVRAMAGYGVPQEEIARVVRCSPPTLRRAFRAELDTAVTEANARVAQCLYQQATTPGNIAASIFWLKARAGWREKHSLELGGPGGTPLPAAQIQVVITDATLGEVASVGRQIEGDRE